MQLSIVIPVYSGEQYLADLIKEIFNVKKNWEENEFPFSINEVIFVDDNSIDNSSEILKEYEDKYNWITCLQLSRNYGQHPASIAGILHTGGDWIVTMDEDLQHHPKHLLELLKVAVLENADLVYANPIKSSHGNSYRDFFSKTFKKLMMYLTGNPYINKTNSFRLIRGDIARGAASVCKFETYLDIALYWFTTSIQSVNITMEDQRFINTGKSSYNFRSLISHARRMLVSSQIKAFRASALLGVLAVIFAFFMGFTLLLTKVIQPDLIPVRGWASLMITLCFFSGFILFISSVTLELMSTLVQSALGKPSFFLVDKTNDKALKEFFKTNDNLFPETKS